MNTHVETSFVNNIPLAHGEITVAMADNAEDIMQHSCKLAASINAYGIATLLINCGVSDQRFRRCAPKTDVKLYNGKQSIDAYQEQPDGRQTMIQQRILDHQDAKLIVHSSIRGNLVDDLEYLLRVIANCNIGAIIISGWEWASSSWRRKERLLYLLRELIEKENIAVVVYSQSKTKPVAGEVDRGGIGKLAMLAVDIIRLETSNTLEAESQRPQPLISSIAENTAAEESAQLLISKINDLQGAKPAITSGGTRHEQRLKKYLKPGTEKAEKRNESGADEIMAEA